MRPDQEVIDKWATKIATMDERECRGVIARMRQKKREGWNVNTRCVYGMLKNRIRLLNQVRGIKVMSELEADRQRADALTLAEVTPAGASRLEQAQGRLQPRWAGEVQRRREWAQEQREKRQASFR